jgi:pyruvate kinase
MLGWGVTPFVEEGYEKPVEYLDKSLKVIKKDFDYEKGDKMVVVSGLKRKKKGYDSIVRVAEI